MEPGQTISFYVEENTTTGFAWFARYDIRMLEIEIEHKSPSSNFFGFVGTPGRAKVKIRSLCEGYTVFELIYARTWEWSQDIAPAKVVQILIKSRD